QMVRRVTGMKRQREQAALAAARDKAADVEERLRADAPSLENLDHPGLLHHVEPPRLARRRGDLGGCIEAAGDDDRLGGSGDRKRGRQYRGEHTPTVPAGSFARVSA